MVTAVFSDAGLRQRAWDTAAKVVDPEIPVLTIADLGVLRDVVVNDGRVEVVITPTYSGCPAMNMITLEIELALDRAGFRHSKVRTVLSTAWTTEWMSEDGRRMLKAYGIAPDDSNRRWAGEHFFRSGSSHQHYRSVQHPLRLLHARGWRAMAA